MSFVIKVNKKFASWLARSPLSAGYVPTLRVHSNAIYRAVVRQQGAIENISAELVESVAHHMEALLTMTEGVPPDEKVVLEFTRREVDHFVAYIRSLDTGYRSLEQELKNIQRVNYERETLQEAQAASARVRSQSATEYQLRAEHARSKLNNQYNEYERLLRSMQRQDPPATKQNYRALAEKAGGYRSPKEK